MASFEFNRLNGWVGYTNIHGRHDRVIPALVFDVLQVPWRNALQRVPDAAGLLHPVPYGFRNIAGGMSLARDEADRNPVTGTVRCCRLVDRRGQGLMADTFVLNIEPQSPQAFVGRMQVAEWGRGFNN